MTTTLAESHVCIHPNCASPRRARGLCRRHYDHARRHGDLVTGGILYTPTRLVSRHIRALNRAGWTGQDIAARAGVPPYTVYSAAACRFRRIRATTADKLFAIRAGL